MIGKIVAPHGVRGEFRIMPLTETPEQFLQLKQLLLEDGRSLSVVEARFHKNVVLMKTHEIVDADAAEALRGKKVVINSADLPPLEEGRFYVADLIGFDVITVDSAETVGKLCDVITTGSTDVFVVHPEKGTDIMIPAIDFYIKKIDVQKAVIEVVLPEWAN